MHGIVRLMSGATYELDVERAFTILDVKDQIIDLTGLTQSKQYLVHAVKACCNEHILSDIRMKSGSLLHLVYRVNSG